MDIAIDLDGTIAALHEAVRDRGWMSWESLKNRTTSREFDYKAYKHHTTNLWYNHADEIELVEDCIPEIIRDIHKHHTTTILTHRVGHDETIMDWLGTHAIPFDDFISTRDPKNEHPHDLYIDDSRINDVNLLLYDRPWNQHLSVENRLYSWEDVHEVL